MIQRVQSLFLLAVTILHAILFFIPVWIGNSTAYSKGEEQSFAITAMGSQCVGAFCEQAPGISKAYDWALVALNTIVMLLSFGVIFLYRDRLRQMRLTRLLMLLEVAFIIVAFLTIEQLKTTLSGLEGNYSFAIAFPIVCLVFLFLAWRRILHDERLVRSADRLR